MIALPLMMLAGQDLWPVREDATGMTTITRVSKVSLTGTVLAVTGILAAGCAAAGSGSSAAAPGPGSSPSAASPSAAAGSTGGATGTPAPSTPAATSGATQAAAPSPAAPAATGGAPACTTGDLKTSIGDGGGGAAGSFYSEVDFTNTSGATCTLYGYPGVSLRNAQSALIGAAATRTLTPRPSVITLAPGAMASATLKMTDYTVYPTSECDPATSAYLLIYPPNQTQSVKLAFKSGTCSNASVKILAVSAVASSA
jgi:Domain of unknown function (DUF4232)